MVSRPRKPKLVCLPDPRLESPSSAVPLFDSSLRELLRDMEKAMLENNGVGLAAIQIGVPLRVFVALIEDRCMSFVNPVLSNQTEWYTATEGCLSIPDALYHPPRPASLSLAWFDSSGAPSTARFVGFAAHVISHEMDHLDGILAPHRVVLGPSQ
jgi:peptide deformylase